VPENFPRRTFHLRFRFRSEVVALIVIAVTLAVKELSPETTSDKAISLSIVQFESTLSHNEARQTEKYAALTRRGARTERVQLSTGAEAWRCAVSAMLYECAQAGFGAIQSF
jgi:hypothetical protein